VNLTRAAIVLRPRSVAEVLDLSFLVAGSRALGVYLRLSLVVLLPCFAVCMALRYALDFSWWSVWLVALLLGSIAQGPFTIAVGQLLFAEEISVRALLRTFRRRFGSYFGALLISRGYLAIAGLTILLLPFAWTRVLFVHEASLLEMATSNVAVKRSTRFVAGHGAQAFLMLMVLLVAHVGSVFLAQVLGDGIVDSVLQLGQPFGVVWQHGGSAYSVLGFFLALPYVATARFLLYIDRRTRSDGWDIQVRFMAIAADGGRRK
jgi:hypothetical protein